ncbi:MAG: transcriptional repressor [Deltaproteobacteria bacterium]|nr:MAG: transcriptional repressor [Deltaproteobacteria bacterium]
MKHIHKQEKDQFKKLFKQDHIDKFEERFIVLEIFLQSEHHVTANELYLILENKGYSFEPDFVTETLSMMCRYGFANKNRFDNGQVRYEHRHLGQHHDHMICTKCKKIFEFKEEKLEALQLKIAASYGFHILQHKMEIYGICTDCLKERTKEMPLTLAKGGEKLIITDIIGGTAVRLRLLTMGLRLGDEIEVITNQNKGQLVIAADYKRYVLGRGFAQKIVVQQQHQVEKNDHGNRRKDAPIIGK